MMSANSMIPAASQAPANNTNATITLAASTQGQAWRIWDISWSYSATPTAGSLVITWGTNTMTFAIATAGPGQLHFAEPLRFDANTEVDITLAAGGNSVSGTVYCTARLGQ